MNRRRFLSVAFGAAAGVALVRFGTTPTQAAPSPQAPPHAADPDLLMTEPGVGIVTHLLPFAPPFPNERAARAEVARGRALRLFG